jgi:diguanylate cyclase (GGDEF)-like protein
MRPRRRRRSDIPSHSPPPGASLAETQLYALVDVAAAAGAAHRLEDVLELAAERALTALGCASLSIGRWEAGWIVTLVNVGRLGPGEERLPGDERYPLDQYPTTARVLSSGGMMVSSVDDPDTDPAHRELLRRLEKESSVTVPVVIEGTTWGELWATSDYREPRLSERDALFLRAIADQIAVAIGRAELFAQVEALAYTDPLTGLANRRVLEHELERTCDAPEGPGAPALLLCDIDGLKAVNDEAGHEAGDAVIVQVAMALTEAALPHEDAVVSRMGGDEFCVLLPGGDEDAARAIAERAAERLRGDSAAPPAISEGAATPRGSEGAIPVRISCGVTARAEGTDRPADLLRAADAAQYRAKHDGPEVPVAVAEPGSGAPDQPGKGRAYRNRSDSASRALATDLLALLDSEAGSPPDEVLERLRRRLGQTFT